MKDPKSYWNDFYQNNQFKNGKEPSKFIQSMLPRLQSGLCLDVAMGEGANAVYLAQKGFEVTGFDISDTAIDRAKTLARDTGVQLEAKTADLDLYLLGVMKYDTVIMTYFRPSVTRYYNAIISALKQGGTLLIESYGIPEMQEAIAKNEEYRNIYFGANEVLKNLKDMRILFYQEGLVDGSHKVQCLAQKPSDKLAQRHDVFGMHAKNKSKDYESSRHIELAEMFFKKYDRTDCQRVSPDCLSGLDILHGQVLLNPLLRLFSLFGLGKVKDGPNFDLARGVFEHALYNHVDVMDIRTRRHHQRRF